MIPITRGAEPIDLARIRDAQLETIRKLNREPTSTEFDGYKIVAEAIWKAQHNKCCYCELRIPKAFNDVEHYRPKTLADRSPGCTSTHGYWWLAFNWENLLFSCPGCNRTSKKAQFPLAIGSTSLKAEETVPGLEVPLLLDPTSLINPVEHIVFELGSIGNCDIATYWWARPRNNSSYGRYTIEVCKLNKDEQRELRNRHVETVVKNQVEILEEAILSGNEQTTRNMFLRAKGLFNPRSAYAALSYDVLRHFIPDTSLIPLIGIGWPTPKEVGT